MAILTGAVFSGFWSTWNDQLLRENKRNLLYIGLLISRETQATGVCTSVTWRVSLAAMTPEELSWFPLSLVTVFGVCLQEGAWTDIPCTGPPNFKIIYFVRKRHDSDVTGTSFQRYN
jgi:hypothetical protein